MSTPSLLLRTMYVLDSCGRIVSTREPGPTHGPLFTLVRGATQRAWAIRADLPASMARELDAYASNEPPEAWSSARPAHASHYLRLLQPLLGARRSQSSPTITGGPAFDFPCDLECPDSVGRATDEARLSINFTGWVAGEIEEGRGPVMAIHRNGIPVSICFCARSGDEAAEAGVETAATFRRLGLAKLVTAAWACAVRASGRIPLYSTSWENSESIGLARSLTLVQYAAHWSVGVG